MVLEGCIFWHITSSNTIKGKKSRYLQVDSLLSWEFMPKKGCTGDELRCLRFCLQERSKVELLKPVPKTRVRPPPLEMSTPKAETLEMTQARSNSGAWGLDRIK